MLALVGAVGAQEGSVGGDYRLVGAGGYYFEVEEELTWDSQYNSIITHVDSDERDALAYVNLFLNGGDVVYEDFLGDTSLKVVLPLNVGDELSYLESRELIEAFYDTGRFTPGRLTSREVRRGNDLFEKLMLDSLEGKDSGVYRANPMSIQVVQNGVDDYLQRMEDYCIECDGLPTGRKLRAIGEFMLDTKRPVNGTYMWDVNFGGNGIRLELDAGLSWIRLHSDLGKTYWDGDVGHLDGELDMVSASYPFLRSEFDLSIREHTVSTDLSVHQWTYDVLVDCLYTKLPFDYRVTLEEFVLEEEARMPLVKR